MNAPSPSPSRYLAVALLLLVGLAGCASSGGARGASSGDSDVLTEEEMADWATQDLYSVVQRLRPRWLQARAPATVQGRQSITIFLDGIRQNGDPDILRNLRTSEIQEVRYMNARDATTRFGTDMTGGALLVVTKR